MKKNKQPKVTSRRPVVASDRPNAFSYHANRSEQDYNVGRLQPRHQAARRRERLVHFWRQRLGMLLAGLIMIVCVLDILHLSTDPTVIIVSKSSSGSSFLRPTKEYQAAAAKVLASSVFNGNKVTIDTAAVQTTLRREFPELSDVSVTLPLMGHRPIVYLAPTTPSLVLATSTGNFVLDNSGRAMLNADQTTTTADAHLTVIRDSSGIRPQLGSVVLPSATITFVKAVTTELQAKGVTIDKLVLPTAADELDVTPGGAGYYIKFNLHDGDAMQQTGTYLAVRQRLQQHNSKPTAYVDVRLNGRAYYK